MWKKIAGGCLVVGLSLMGVQNWALHMSNDNLLKELRSAQETREEMGQIIESQRQSLLSWQEDYVAIQAELVEAQKMSGWIEVPGEATAYAPQEEEDGFGMITSTGTRPGPNTFAVDPRRIPYGSSMILIYPNGTVKRGTAGDTGGALRRAKGIVVDTYAPTIREAILHGRQQIIVLYKKPGE